MGGKAEDEDGKKVRFAAAVAFWGEMWGSETDMVQKYTDGRKRNPNALHGIRLHAVTPHQHPLCSAPR